MPVELGRIDLGDVTPHNIKLLRKVNTVVFPVSYHDKFYKVRGVWLCMLTSSLQDVLEAGELAKLAYFNDIVVGAVCCRVDLQGSGRKVGTDTSWIVYTTQRVKPLLLDFFMLKYFIGS